MLTLLNPMEAVKFSDVIYESMKRVLDENGETVDKDSLVKALSSKALNVWVIRDQDSKAAGFITTLLYSNALNRSISLFVYTIETFEQQDLSIELVNEIFDTLRSYAKKINCKTIFGYSSNQSVINIARRIGGHTKNVMIEFEV